MPAAPESRSLTDRIKARALALGFTGCGAAAAGAALSRTFYGDWLAAGHAGAMQYLERHASLKADPRGLLPGARSLLLTAFNYRPPEQSAPPGLRGRVARYAWGEDYHDVLWAKLEKLAAAVAEEAGHPVRARPFVDTAPVMEREWAARAALGWVGKNANLIHWQQGSWLFLGGLVLDLALDCDMPDLTGPHPDGPRLHGPRPDSPAPDGLKPDETARAPIAGKSGAPSLGKSVAQDVGAWLRAQESCGACRICLDACPTGAIVADKTVDARRCIAYLTIELKGPVPRELRPQLGAWVFGCDVCQEVCPWNRAAPETSEPAFAGTPQRAWPELTELLALDEAGFRARFGASALRRTRRRGLARNAALALGNRLAEAAQGSAPVALAEQQAERQSAATALAASLADPEPVVRGAAAWAIAQGGLGELRDALTAALRREADSSVREEMGEALARLAAHPAAGVA